MGILVLTWLVGVSVAGADRLQAVLPVSLGARVITGPTWDGVVVVEPYDIGKVLVTVEAVLVSPRSQGGFGAGLEGKQGLLASSWRDANQHLENFPVPQELASAARLAPWERAVEVVSWVSRFIRPNAADSLPQDALSVLRRREGRCSGRANLAVALLRQLGLPARIVHGLLFSVMGASWHRWGEVWIPGLGWRPFDPGVAIGMVGAHYLPMVGAGEGLDLSGVALLRLEEREFSRLPQFQGLKFPAILIGKSVFVRSKDGL